MYKSIILPLAKEDIREAARWYNSRQTGLGKRFTKEVREKVHFIRQNSESSNVRYNNVRTNVLNMFPFMIHYTVDEKNKTVIFLLSCIQVETPNYGKVNKLYPFTN